MDIRDWFYKNYIWLALLNSYLLLDWQFDRYKMWNDLLNHIIAWISQLPKNVVFFVELLAAMYVAPLNYDGGFV